uniref:Glutaredoxin domain-containing protein n=1 Tax=viral metagenome TaxID=1070528 RepID=A0A6C0DBR0_9ZZZZ
MDILYYSNYCKHCQRLVNTLVKGNLSNKISFICIDKRVRDPKNNQQYIVLENGSKVVMPPNIHSVPALLLIKQNYRLLMGDEIMQHLHPQIKQLNEVATNYNGEPISYTLGGSSGGSNIMSEQYTFYNMTPDELSAKGKGTNRQMYNYVSASDDIKLINTPPDNYRPDKLSNNVTIESLQQQRLNEIETNKGVGFI